jgi:hypothetical protein
METEKHCTRSFDIGHLLISTRRRTSPVEIDTLKRFFREREKGRLFQWLEDARWVLEAVGELGRRPTDDPRETAHSSNPATPARPIPFLRKGE